MLLVTLGALAGPRILALDFSAQGWRTLPPELKIFPGLLRLDLSFNRLTEFQPPSTLSKLETLDLDANQLARQPESLKALKHLKWLSLQGNLLTTFSGQGLGRMWHLDLESNYLKSVEHLEGMPGLRELNISNNELDTLPPTLKSLQHLILLDASGNGLEQLGPELFALTKVQDLDLSRNQLRQLPTGIGNLSSLVRLDLSQNQLTRLPPELGRLGNLQYLSINSNPGLKVDKSITGLRKNLKVLYLDDKALPDDPGVLLLWLPDTAIVLFDPVRKEKVP